MSVAADIFRGPEHGDPEPGSFQHTTVLRSEVLAALSPSGTGVYVDATLGGGGHAEGILGAAPEIRLVGVDRDQRAIAASRERLARFGERVTLVHGRFSDLPRILGDLRLGPIDGLLADLGVSSPQIDDPERGMSFRTEGPLDMRMDPSSGETVLDLIARVDTDELANLIYGYGEERRSRRIARCIHQAWEAGELATTTDLRRAVVRAVGPARVGGVDPATRTFQALRIAVNAELDELVKLLELSPSLLLAGGRMAVISFHSLEDRLVKRAFWDRDVWEKFASKPVTPSLAEMDGNPRARSAKLRAARRIEVIRE